MTLTCENMLSQFTWFRCSGILSHFCCRLWDLLPRLRSEIESSFARLLGVAKGLAARFQDKHPFYSARFSCQLNITEFNYSPDDPKCRPKLQSRDRRPPSPAKPAPLLRHDLRSRSLEDLVRGNPRLLRSQRKSYAGLPIAKKDERVISSLNFGFTMNLSGTDAISHAERGRRKSVVDTLRTLNENQADGNVDVDAIELTNRALNWEKECIEHSQRKEDTRELEQILTVTQKKEALMAFYYTDEVSHKVHVTELFNVTDPKPSLATEEATDLALNSASPACVETMHMDQFSSPSGVMQHQPFPAYGPAKPPRRKNSVVFMN